jgi:NitT/TauT family transport system substrate-binding protein
MKKSHVKGMLYLVLSLSVFTFPVYGQRETVNLAIGFIPHVQFAPLYVGIEKDFYAKENIDLKIEYGFGIDIFSLLVTGKIDLGLSDSDQLIIAGSKGLDLKAVFQYYQKYPVTIVAKSGVIRTPGDFAGKKIGTPELYGTSFIGLQLFLEKYGLKNKVTVERIGYTQIPSLLGDKLEGVVCFFNNEPLQLRESGVSIVQWDVRDFSDVAGASFLTSETTLNKKREILRGFVRATAEAISYTVRNQDEAYSLSEKYIGKQDPVKREFLKKVLAATCSLFESPLGYGKMDEAKYQQSVEILLRLGLISKTFSAGTLVRNLQ